MIEVFCYSGNNNLIFKSDKLYIVFNDKQKFNTIFHDNDSLDEYDAFNYNIKKDKLYKHPEYYKFIHKINKFNMYLKKDDNTEILLGNVIDYEEKFSLFYSKENIESLIDWKEMWRAPIVEKTDNLTLWNYLKYFFEGNLNELKRVIKEKIIKRSDYHGLCNFNIVTKINFINHKDFIFPSPVNDQMVEEAFNKEKDKILKDKIINNLYKKDKCYLCIQEKDDCFRICCQKICYGCFQNYNEICSICKTKLS